MFHFHPKHICCSLMAVVVLMLASCTGGTRYDYETVEGDPLHVKIHTLPNGLKIYMTVNPEQPRIQANIAVRAGGKNDPAETTGLAHYFEHLMFKGTEQFGTMNYEAEKPLLDEIEQLFEVYRTKTDETERRAIYRQIDSVSYEASKYAIANEYDKLMAAIGASGTNAYTGYDMTVYVEDIPSNQVENWARVQADRFKHNVIRGFHTELEAVYEEKNMSLTRDIRKVVATIFEELFKCHPYGTQTVLGTQEQLKNPSITNIKRFYSQWYVPNNMAICLSGDFDPDTMVDIIARYFGDMQPNPELPTLQFAPEEPIESPRVRDVIGLEAQQLWLAWRFPGAASKESDLLNILSSLLYNGQAGLIDLDLNQTHHVLEAAAFTYPLADYSALMMYAEPMPGQSLDEARDLLMAEVEKIQRGEFDDALLEAVVNDYKRSLEKKLEDNDSRAEMLVDAFINGVDWRDEAGMIDRIARITRQEVIDFANRYITESNYVRINKQQGTDPNEVKIAKPEITPILTNRDTASTFLREIQHSEVAPIEPRFLDYGRDLSVLTAGNSIPVYYKQNEMNGLFELTYLFDMGYAADRKLSLAASYLDYLGTDSLSAEEVKKEFYRLGCNFTVQSTARRTYIVLSGLDENLQSALQLMEQLLHHAHPDASTYATYVQAEIQARANNMARQASNFQRLRQYVMYGPEVVKRYTMSNKELQSTDPAELTDRIRSLCNYQHRILYYGPRDAKSLTALLEANHTTPATLLPALENQVVPMRPTTENRVFVAPYEANQLYMSQYASEGKLYDPAAESARSMYNEYFGGGMNSIVFQEMRESRALAYSAWGFLAAPSFHDDPYYFFTSIATQNDKMPDAIGAFNEIIEQMPESEPAFAIARQNLITSLRTQRTTRSEVLWSYVNALEMGETADPNIRLFDEVQNLSLADVIAFQQQWVKGRKYFYCVLGNKKSIDMKMLKTLGPVQELTTEEIYGY